MSYMHLDLHVDQLYRVLLRGYLSSPKTITVLQKIMTINSRFPIITKSKLIIDPGVKKKTGLQNLQTTKAQTSTFAIH